MSTPTPQQEAVYAAIAGEQHVVVQARAGAGKTTTAVGSAKRARGKVGVMAFNKHIVAEIKPKLDGAAKAMTGHGLGYAACMRAFPGCELEEAKPKRLLERLRPSWCWRGPRGGLRVSEQGQAALSLARTCKMALADPDLESVLLEVAEHNGIELPDRADERGEVLAAVPLLLDAMAAETSSIDFDDQLWLPVHLGLPVERFDVLLVDEAQDLSPLQQRLAVVASAGGRLVPIGDDRQAINGFAGADPAAFGSLSLILSARERGMVHCPLTVSFRCPLSAIALAQAIVPDIQAALGAIDGTVSQQSEDEAARGLVAGDMVISRRSAPLLSLAFKLIARNVPVLVRGRDIGRGLIEVIDEHPGTPQQFLAWLNDWFAREGEKLEKKDAPESQVQNLSDRYQCLRELACGAATMKEARDKVTALFGDERPEGKVLLSSIHRAKGLEAEKVVIIDTECLPMTLACRFCKGLGRFADSGNECPRCRGRGTRAKAWQHEQERNLAYVAVTRTRRELIFAGPIPSIFGGAF